MSYRISQAARLQAEREAGLVGNLLAADPDLCMSQQIHRTVLVRFTVVAAIIGGALFARYVVGVYELPVAWLCILALLLLLGNVITHMINRPYRAAPKPNPTAQPFLHGVMHLTVTLDFLFLVVALWLVGGPQSPFQAFFIFHVIIASVLLSRRAAFAYALFAYALVSLLTVGLWMGVIPAFNPHGAVPSQEPLDGRFVITVLFVNGLLFTLVAILLTSLVRSLRHNMHELWQSGQELDRLSQLRRDFLHIAMHNLRSPISVVSMHMSNMANGYGGELTEKQRGWVDRAQARLGELQTFLNDLEFLTALDSDKFAQQGEDLDTCDVIADLLVEVDDLVKSKGHELVRECPDEPLYVHAVPRLVREMVVNFLTNAVKYTPRGGKIIIRTRRRGDYVRIEVEDNGIGITKEDQARLFQEFVRIKRDEPSLEKVHGSGLGLSIVRRIAELHKGRVDVQSALNQGSVFAIELPAVEQPVMGSEPRKDDAD